VRKYRICPYGLDMWKVQRKRLGFWFDVTTQVAADMSLVRTFNIEADAERWIEDQHDEVEVRRASIKPRVYPVAALRMEGK